MKKLASLLLIGIIIGCTNQKDSNPTSSPEANDIVTKAIGHHGGQDYWERLQTISYNKITVLFDSTGKQESGMVQKHSYRLKPELEATIKWIEKGDSIRISFKDNKANKYVNSIPDLDASEASKNIVHAGIYVLFQPFKLMDAGTTLRYEGIDSLDGRAVNIVKPVYAGYQPGDDEWFFYFDAGSDELIANMVIHNGKRSLIKNLAFDYSSSLMLHQHRKSYFVDSMFHIQYLRAEYFYTNYNLTFVDKAENL